MALKHIRSVQKHAITTDPMGRSILVTIAADIGHDNQPAYPSYRTIAGRVGCHYNTVSSWIAKLEECGDLTVTKKKKRQYYNISFVTEQNPLSQSDYDKDCDNGCDKDYDNLKEVVTTLSQQVAKLSQRVSQIVTVLDVTEVEDIEEEDIYIDNRYIPNSNAIVTPVTIRNEDILNQMITALSTISRETLWPKTEQDFQDAAYELIGRDVTPDDIKAFDDWWATNGWHKQKPVLKNILNSWQDFKSGKTISQNGTDKHEGWQQLVGLVSKHSRYGAKAKAELPNSEWEIVKRMGGWGHVRMMSEKQIKINYFTARKELSNG